MTEELPKNTDPRVAGGSIAGPGGAWDRGGVIIDATDAVLLDDLTVALVDGVKDGVKQGPPIMAMQMAGRINKTQERAQILFIFDEDGAGAIISELLALSVRNGGGDELLDVLQERLQSLMAEGHM